MTRLEELLSLRNRINAQIDEELAREARRLRSQQIMEASTRETQWAERVGTRSNGALLVAMCGTESGYKKHRRNGEERCQPCKAAHAKSERERKARRRQEREERVA